MIQRINPGARMSEAVVHQGTATVHIYNDKLEEAAKLEMTPHGVRVPHMIDFTPDGAYALIAATASANVTVVRTKDRQVVATLATGPASHAATVRPDGCRVTVWLAVHVLPTSSGQGKSSGGSYDITG